MLLVDTNIWLAAADISSRHHSDCARLLQEHGGELASTVPVISETAWLLLDRIGPAAQKQFLTTITSLVQVIDLTPADWDRVVKLVGVYADLALDVIDASTIAVAERLGQTIIATLDHRDFRIVRPAHTEAFRLLPE